jgi:CheY-like chemotaxis protein
MPTDHISAPATHRALILVVDDQPFVARVIADALALEGYEVDTAKDGREALGKIGACSYDVILSDLRMPELDGVGLYRELHRHYPSLLRRLAIVSGTTEPAEYSTFLETTGVPILNKPFAVEDLYRIVQRLLRDPR